MARFKDFEIDDVWNATGITTLTATTESIDSGSTNYEYPTAKAVYDMSVSGDTSTLESTLSNGNNSDGNNMNIDNADYIYFGANEAGNINYITYDEFGDAIMQINGDNNIELRTNSVSATWAGSNGFNYIGFGSDLYVTPTAQTSSNTIYYPDASGTIALLSDINSAITFSDVLTSGNTTSGNDIVMTNADVIQVWNESGDLATIYGDNSYSGGADIVIGSDSGLVKITADAGLNVDNGINVTNSLLLTNASTYNATLSSDNLTSTYTFQFPDKAGTIALTNDLEWTYLGEYTGGTIDVSSIPTGSTVKMVYYNKNDYGSGANKSLEIQFNSLTAKYQHRNLQASSSGFNVVSDDTKLPLFTISTSSVDIKLTGELYIDIDAMYDTSHLSYYLPYKHSNFISTEGFLTEFLYDGYNSDVGSSRLNDISIVTSMDHQSYKIYYKSN